MGVAYSHGIFVEDLDWRPTWHHVAAVRGVLAKWGFAPMEPEFFLLTDESEPLDEADVRSSLPDNLMATYEGLEGEQVTRIMGPSMYKDLADEDRYIFSVIAIYGVDFKVVDSETLDAEVIEPPTTNGVAVENSPAREQFTSSFVYPATWATTPPRTKANTEFSGVWRSGITIECDKDVPEIADTRPLPCELVRDLEQAFGTKLVEQGWFH
jgi:hypothetical protein